MGCGRRQSKRGPTEAWNGAAGSHRAIVISLILIPQAVDFFRRAQFLVIVDDENRENEGDLAIAAEKISPEAINFMATFAKGLICLPMIGKRLQELDIPLMVESRSNTSNPRTAFTVSVDARRNTTTGISSYDRAATVHALLDAATVRKIWRARGTFFLCCMRKGACW